MKKLLLSIATVALISAGTVKATGAFFTDTKTSTNNTFTAGTLTISLDEQNSTTPFQGETLISNWQPGQDAIVNFDVLNSGTLPLELRGFATGTWGAPSLDSQNMVHVTKVERFNGSTWDTLLASSSINGYFYYTNNGLVGGTFFDVAPGSRAQLRLTVNLDQNAGNDFQSHVFTSSLQVEARQATSPTTTWP